MGNFMLITVFLIFVDTQDMNHDWYFEGKPRTIYVQKDKTSILSSNQILNYYALSKKFIVSIFDVLCSSGIAMNELMVQMALTWQ